MVCELCLVRELDGRNLRMFVFKKIVIPRQGVAPPGGVAMPMPGDGGGAPTYNAPYQGYPQQPGYPQQQPGYTQQQPGYPQQQPGYPQQQPGYPSQQPGYPAPQQPQYGGGGYPAAGGQPGYPAPGGQPGYPASGGQPGYPGAAGAAAAAGYGGYAPAPAPAPTQPPQAGAYPVLPTAPDQGGKKSKDYSAPTDAMSKLSIQVPRVSGILLSSIIKQQHSPKLDQ
jgi:hypothetical protein